MILSCKHADNQQQNNISEIEIGKQKELGKDENVELAKQWIIKNVEEFFMNFDSLKGNYSKICTEQYTEFKSDATNVDIDGGMSEGEFKTKWGRRYSEYAGIQEGFLVPGTDFGKIKVTKCEFKNKTEMGVTLGATIAEPFYSPSPVSSNNHNIIKKSK
jgi:hypothetical protein